MLSSYKIDAFKCALQLEGMSVIPCKRPMTIASFCERNMRLGTQQCMRINIPVSFLFATLIHQVRSQRLASQAQTSESTNKLKLLQQPLCPCALLQ